MHHNNDPDDDFGPDGRPVRMDLLIRGLDRSLVRQLNILAAVAGMSRTEFIRQLLEREGARLAMDVVRTAIDNIETKGE